MWVRERGGGCGERERERENAQVGGLVVYARETTRTRANASAVLRGYVSRQSSRREFIVVRAHVWPLADGLCFRFVV